MAEVLHVCNSLATFICSASIVILFIVRAPRLALADGVAGLVKVLEVGLAQALDGVRDFMQGIAVDLSTALLQLVQQ